MKKLLIFAVILLVAAFALSSANAKELQSHLCDDSECGSETVWGYNCDGCDLVECCMPESWVKVYVFGWRTVKGDRALRVQDKDWHVEVLYFCGTCRKDPEQQRKLGANLMKNGRWVKPSESAE